jgi:hypothetical protein
MAETRLLNVKRMLEPSGVREDFALRAGDLLFVPQSKVSKIERYVRWGSFGTYLPVFR